MSSSYTFKWPAGPQEVIVTGTFDSWSKTLPLVKQADGSFEITVPLEKEDTFYKYVVDGEWLTSDSQKKQQDSNGIENNFLEGADLHVASNGSRIPESGGLFASSAPVSTTVMPKTEGQQQTLGEPGIFIPKDKDALAAFEKVEDVDSRHLSPEEKKKQKKKLKKIQYKARKKQKAAAEKLGSAESESVSPEPEFKSEKKETGLDAGTTVHGSVVPVPEQQSPEVPEKEVFTDAPGGPETITPEVSEKDIPESTEKDEAPTDGHPIVSVLATTEIIETVIPVEQEIAAEPLSKEVEPAAEPISKEAEPAAEPISKEEPVSDNTSVNPSIVAVHQANVVPTVVPTPDVEKEEIAPVSKEAEVTPVTETPVVAAVPETPVKEASPVAIAAPEHVARVDSEIPPPNVAEENQNTLDPTVVGVIGASDADAVAADISKNETSKRAVEPAIKEPIEPVQSKKEKLPESVLAAPIKPLGAKSEPTEEIIITQGGDDVNAIEEQIIAHENGPVSVEQIQPTESEAKELAHEAHIPESQLGLDKKKKASAKKPKDKKKSGFMSKLKKMFK